jgi:hypothetical protein
LRARSVRGRSPAYVAALLLAGTPAASAALASQGTTPLRKTDLIRLLANPLIQRGEIAEVVRRNCLSFRPSERDWSDLRSLGADADVLGSVGACSARGAPPAQTAPAPAPTPAPAPASPAAAPAGSPAPVSLVATFLNPRVAAVVGARATVPIQLKRADGTPARGVMLALRPTPRLVAGPPGEIKAVTDDSGFAAFDLPAGRAAGRYRLELVGGSGAPLPGRPVADLIVTPGPPTSAEVLPASFEFGPGDSGAVAVAQPRRRADPSPAPPVAGSTAPQLDAAFVHGAVQRGLPRTRLADALTFQVRTPSGVPLPGKVVTFQAVNAEVDRDSAVTDSGGKVALQVRLGMKAGRALVTALVDTLRRQDTLEVEPGVAVELVLEREDVRVDGGRILVELGIPFNLTLRARDRYGNATPTATLTARLGELRSAYNARADRLLDLLAVQPQGAAIVLTFKPMRLGSTDLKIDVGLSASVAMEVIRKTD